VWQVYILPEFVRDVGKLPQVEARDVFALGLDTVLWYIAEEVGLFLRDDLHFDPLI
jgi:hypothetical protein